MWLSKPIPWLFIGWIGFSLITGCSSSDSYQKKTPRLVDFDQYSTFYFPEPVVASSDNPVFSKPQLSERVEQEISFILSNKRLDKSTRNPDLAIYYYAITESEVDITVLPYRIGWAAEPFINSGEILENYPGGTFVIDFVDVNMDQLVWRGSTQLPFQNTETLYRVMPDSIQKLLDRFPRLPN